MADAYFYNEKGSKIEIFCTSLSGVEVVALTIDEAVNYELFAVRGRTLSLTFVTNNTQLYYNSLRGQSITIKEDNATIFEGVITTTPQHQPFSYKVERFTLYADDTLTAKKYTTYDKDKQTISAFLASCLPSYTFTQSVGIDTTKAVLALEALTETTTTEFDVLTELARLLNVEICSSNKTIESALTGTAVAVSDHYATTQLGMLDGIHSAKISIQEETSSEAEGQAEEESTVTEWLSMVKNLWTLWRKDYGGSTDYVTPPQLAGLYRGNTFNNETGEISNPNSNTIKAGEVQYYRLGFTEGVTYREDSAWEIQKATDIQDDFSQSISTPKGTPAWKQSTLIRPQYALAIGAKTSAEQDLCFADTDAGNVYFTRPYSVSVPSVTTFKPQTYLLINGHIDIFPYTSFADHTLFRTDSLVKYKSQEITPYPFLLLTIRLYQGSTLLKTLTDVEAKLDTKKEIYRNGEHPSPFSLDVLDTTDWNTGTKETGFKVQLTYNEVKDCDRLEVDFKGAGGFVGTIYNNVYDPNPNEQHTNQTVKYACLEWIDTLNGGVTKTDATQILCDLYTVDLDFCFASGYLEDETPTEIETDGGEPGEESETWFYWQQNGGIDEVEYSNRLNSLLTFPTKNTVRIDDGYLEKVTSTIYSGSHYTEEYQLATIIDQRKDGSSVLRIDLATREKLITFRGVKYRLCGCSYDVVRGVWECEYIEVKPTTQID